MPNYWLLKTEPSAYSYDRLERDAGAVWDGVKNPVALKNLRAMQPGDAALIYHTGDEKAAVGVAEIVTAAYADPKARDPKLVRSEEHTSELQSRLHLVCRLLLEKKKKKTRKKDR